jgi:hypothetical protein
MRPGLRLLLARLAAWTLLFTGWLGLGALALQHGPAGWAQFAPQALWLGTVAVAQPLMAHRPPGAAALRGLLLAAGLVTAAAIGSTHWAAAALAWGLLLVAASNAVRRLRGVVLASGVVIDSPRGPALAGALLAALLAGEPRAWVAAPVLAAALPLGLALLLALLLPPTAAGRPGCGSALFDCALGHGGPDGGPGTGWPRLAALAMLPMMASLPAMAELCRAQPTPWLPGAQVAVALHLLAMLAPAGWPGRAVRAVPILLLGGGLTVLIVPGSTGLMLGMGLQAMAWGCVWRDSLAQRAARGRRLDAPPAPAPTSMRWARLLPAASVLGLGAALQAAPWAPAAAWSLPPLLLGLAALLALSATARALPLAGDR